MAPDGTNVTNTRLGEVRNCCAPVIEWGGIIGGPATQPPRATKPYPSSGLGRNRSACARAKAYACGFNAFDLLELDGADMRREPIEVRKATLASILRKSRHGVRLNEQLEHPEAEVVFRHACKTGLEGIVSKRLGSRYRSGRSPDWLKFKNPHAPAVKREAEEDWGR
jgi:hypothetical protein